MKKTTSKAAVRRPLWKRMTIYGFAAVLFASCMIGGLAWYRQDAMSESAMRAAMRNDVMFVKADMDAQKRAASALALALAGEPDTASLIQSNARDAFLLRYKDSLPAIVDKGSLQLITFSNADTKVVARIHEPDKFGDLLKGRRKMIEAALASGQMTSGIEPGRTAVSVFASAPVSQFGKVVGIVDIGTKLTDKYFARLAETLDADIAVKIYNGSGFDRQASTFGTGEPLSDDEVKTVFEGGKVQKFAEMNGKNLAITAFPLTNYSGANIGVLELGANVTEMAVAADAALWETVIGTIVVSLLSLVGFMLFARSLGGAIQRLTGTMGGLAGGDLSVEVEGRERPDEIGAMAAAVEVFKQTAIDQKRLEDEASALREKQAEEEARLQAAQQAKAEELRAFVRTVGTSFDRLSEGDLTVRMDRKVAEEFEPIRGKFNESVEKLEGAIGEVVTSIASIRTGLGEISTASSDLASRTEQQAASLEETVAAFGEVTSGVNRTASGAGKAENVAAGARDKAVKGGEVVQRAIAAMNQIDSSSQQINQIISVIDEIAFQTNLLALNAGVEAARAGDAGRGFAVVAQEVRGLAQRSAEAAKEIKDLISTSREQVESGVDLVAASGKSLEEIVAEVSQVAEVIADIATGAREQATSLREVSTAADQMDKVTQQNAAMVEEATAASQTLASETDELAASMARFRTSRSPAGQGRSAAGGARAAGARPAAPTSRPQPRPVAQLKATGTGGAAAAPPPAPANDGWEEF